MYSGETGEQLTMEFFMGPCYYMRLKHMVKDKINYRAQGPRTMITRQTVQGRANDGGLRIGEMERDGIIAHGATAFLKESMLDRGDDYYIAICNTSGTIAIYNESKNIFISPFSDGPLKFSENFENTMNLEVISKYGKSFSIVRIPYSFKLLIQELQVMNIQMRIITEDNIDQLTSMNYAKTITNFKLTKLSRKEEEDYNKKYEGIKPKEKPKTTRQIIDEDIKPEIIDLDKKGPISQEQSKSEDEDEDDNDGLSQVTIDSIKRAEDEFSRYQDLEDYENDEKEPIKIGDVVNSEELGIENLNVEKLDAPKQINLEQQTQQQQTQQQQTQQSQQQQTQQQQTQQQQQQQYNPNIGAPNIGEPNIEAPNIEIQPILLQNITSEAPLSIEKLNSKKSENMKTIFIKDQ
jgi:DNA-directed RNA polymerase II subunit RPB2